MKLIASFKKNPLRWQWVAFGVVTLFCYLFFVHPDVIETANHSYLLLDSTFKGRFFDFYNFVIEKPFGKTLYYINNAHYNIVIYIIFAIFELPVYIITNVFHLGINEPLLYYIGKFVSLGFFIACIPVVKKIALELGFSELDSHWASFFFALFPPAFFSAVIMGQYDTLCLFFLLVGFLYWLRNDMWKFVFWFGLGAACKFFPLFLFIPLLLLKEKRILHIIKYGICSLWLVIPTTLLFFGRTGDMSAFNDVMIERLFAAKISAAMNVSVFPILFLLVCFVCYLWKPAKERLPKIGLWVCLAVLSILFFFVDWHPQWLILLAPFMVLTTFAEKNRLPWFLLDIIFSIGFFILCAIVHPNQLEANLFDFGLIGIITNLRTTSNIVGYNSISFYYNTVFPIIGAIPMVLIGGTFIAQTILKRPTSSGTLATRLSKDDPSLTVTHYGWMAWILFGVSISVWLLPTIYTWLKCFNIL